MNRESFLLTHDGQPHCSIVMAHDAPSKVIAAASDLQAVLHRMSGVQVPIQTDEKDCDGTLILVGRSRLTEELNVHIPTGYPKNEGFVLRTYPGSETCAPRLVLAGNDEGTFQETAFAVTEFLERLGCGWYGLDELWHVVSKQPTIMVPPLDVHSEPAFLSRGVWRVSGELRERWRLGGLPLSCGHALGRLFPPAEYFDEHPEFYPLIDGRRTAEGEWQPCTTNPDVIRLTVEKARNAFDNSDTAVMFSLSNNDCGGFCECDDCLASGENPGARMLTYANAVGRELRKTHLDKYVTFLAYWYTLKAPNKLKKENETRINAPNPSPNTEMKAEPNVIVMVVNEGCHAHALDDPTCPRNRDWCENFLKWKETGATMAIYEWYIPGCKVEAWRSIPWVSGEVAVRNLHWWKQHGVRFITYESQYEKGSGFPLRWPLYYVASLRMWDIEDTADALLTEACQKLYGAAAEHIRNYYRTLEEAMTTCPEHSNIWNLPNPLTVYTEAVVNQLRHHLSQAQRVAQPIGGLVWERVQQDIALWAEAEEALEALGTS